MRVSLRKSGSGAGRNRARVPPANAAGDIDLRRLGAVLWRKKWRVIIPTALVAVLATIGVNAVTPKYKSEARVLVEVRENVFLRPDAEKTAERQTIDQEAITSQVQLVLSRDLAREVTGKLKLGELPEFDPVLRGVSAVKGVLAGIGLIKDPLRMTPEERVIESYYERLNAYSIDRSRVIGIDFQSEDPDLAARVANAIAEVYLSLQQSAKQDQARAASQWLAGEIAGMRGKVSEAEARVEEFRGKTNLFVGTNNTTLSGQQLGEYNSQLSTARAQKIDAETKARLIRDMLKSGRPVEASEVLNSELIRRLTEQRVTLRAQLAEQSSTLLDQHPRIKELRAQIGDLEQQMRNEAETIVRSLEHEAKVAGARQESLGAGLDQLKQQAASNGGQDVQLRALEREAKAQRDLLESYLAKYREATTRESIDGAPADARVISRALVSNTPAYPKKVPVILVATLATLFLSLGSIAAGELLNNGQATEVHAPAESAADLPDVASPALGADAPPPPSHVIGVPIATVEELARQLRAAAPAGRRVAVAGVRRHVGTTIAAITLARTLSREARVILVDLAFEAPHLAAISSDPAAPGIADLVRGTASFGQIITRDRLSRLHLIGAGQGHGATELDSPRLAMTLDALGRSYDHVVVDAGADPDVVERFDPSTTKVVLIAADAVAAETIAASERLRSVGHEEPALLVAEPLVAPSFARTAA
jgi:succinoglycan biosynthesis transport protein ExoP